MHTSLRSYVAFAFLQDDRATSAAKLKTKFKNQPTNEVRVEGSHLPLPSKEEEKPAK